ncbi:hypothetical protein BN175_1610012 [Clostridioides difficile T23]|nr:hypothetical protein BN169_750103 [Clostridioides difficile E16]CCL14449.1 hypothetical protein BN170_1790032 [Clostridioides difficile T22]CCL18565.1 hypothetical protein BN171_2440006 [Clostridioides difficile E25]CCL22482.1 hypothetical protein BN172_3300006 [Clostridioides difficile T15]CCL34372.1 hypothetical protein BN175_1610012 [Clostridioides difficile T23]CCL38204.1 hypothetical protein BN176_1970016 [Clostridioides difficile E19]CCL41132.1 hypothetical protein BN177_230087 [Clos
MYCKTFDFVCVKKASITPNNIDKKNATIDISIVIPNALIKNGNILRQNSKLKLLINRLLSNVFS